MYTLLSRLPDIHFSRFVDIRVRRTRAPFFPASSAVESFKYFIRMDYVNIS